MRRLFLIVLAGLALVASAGAANTSSYVWTSTHQNKHVVCTGKLTSTVTCTVSPRTSGGPRHWGFQITPARVVVFDALTRKTLYKVAQSTAPIGWTHSPGGGNIGSGQPPPADWVYGQVSCAADIVTDSETSRSFSAGVMCWLTQGRSWWVEVTWQGQVAGANFNPLGH